MNPLNFTRIDFQMILKRLQIGVHSSDSEIMLWILVACCICSDTKGMMPATLMTFIFPPLSPANSACMQCKTCPNTSTVFCVQSQRIVQCSHLT